jgi:hypothetical protein
MIREATAKYLPPPWIEHGYYAQVVYSIMGVALGVSLGSLGIVMLAGLGLACVLRMGKMGRYVIEILRPAALLIACGVSHIAVQIVVHGSGLRDDYIREFVPWLASLVVVQHLALRHGFLHRSAMFMVLLGLSTLPYLRTFAQDPTRTGLAGITIGNPNDLGGWFAFCCVYLMIVGLETKRNWLRAVSWSTALGCLVVVALTVSRGPLFAAACALVLAFRRMLKRGFYPFFLMVVAAWVAFGLGLLDQSAARYTERGMEQSGRFSTWPVAIGRFLASPIFGVGVENLGTPDPVSGRLTTPHNSFIFFGLTSGVVPLVFFGWYWLKLARDALRLNAASHEDAAFHLPLLLYSFMTVLMLNQPFMLPWMMCSMAAISSAQFVEDVRSVVQSRRRRAERGFRYPGMPPLAGRRDG